MADITPAPGAAAATGVAPLLHAAFGGAGVATFAMLMEAGATVTLQFGTDVKKMLDGTEQRASFRAKPRQRYAFSSLLSDAQHRKLLSTLAGNAATAPLFLLGLPYEEQTVVSSTSTTITASSLDYSDWKAPGQRIVVVSPAGVQGEAIVQSAAGAVLTVDQDLTAVATRGARVMPAVGVYLEPEQAISRHKVKLGRWELAARMERNGFAGGAVGTGASLTTFDGLAVWDAGVAHAVAAQPLMAGYSIVDLGGRISAIGSYDHPDWGRGVRIDSGGRAAPERWAWLKKFLDSVQGMRKAFLLPTGRPDLVPVGTAASGTLTIDSANGVDYVNDWYPSLAHRRLRLVRTDGTFGYRSVSSLADNGSTQDLVLDSAFTGTLDRVEFLETVRLASDEVTVKWRGYGFESALIANVVQG